MISTKGRYAIRVMIDLAENGGGGCVPLKDVASRQQLSKKYLEIIVKDLVSGGLLSAVSGKGGGYRLVRPAEDYTVGEILRSIEDNLAPVSCIRAGSIQCDRAAECLTLPMWKELDDITNAYLDTVTLQDLLSGDKWKPIDKT